MSGIQEVLRRAMRALAFCLWVLAPMTAQAQLQLQLQNPGLEGSYQNVSASKRGITGQVAAGWVRR